MKFRVGSAPQSKRRGIGNSDSGFLRAVLKIALIALFTLLALPAAPQVAQAQVVIGEVQLYLDGRTGEVIADKPAEDSLALSRLEIEMLSTSSAGLTVSRRSDGAVIVDLQGRFGHLATATVGPDGRLQTHCADPIAAGHPQ